MAESTERSIGRLEAKMASLEDRMSGVESKLDSALKILSTARGGWRMLLLIGGGTAAVIGALAAIVDIALKAIGKLH